MRALVVGATGLLGHATAAALVSSGHEVTLLARTAPAVPLPALEGAALTLGDAWTMPDNRLRRLLGKADWLVYALGPDDRSPVPVPAAAFFERHLVEASARVFTLAAQAGVAAATLFGSYFTAWARTHPGFAGRHAYVAARQRQAAACLAAGGDTTRVTVLEVPWVFGTVPGRVPMWREWLLPRIDGPVVAFPRGGTTLATARTCGRTALAALERGRAGATTRWATPTGSGTGSSHRPRGAGPSSVDRDRAPLARRTRGPQPRPATVPRRAGQRNRPGVADARPDVRPAVHRPRHHPRRTGRPGRRRGRGDPPDDRRLSLTGQPPGFLPHTTGVSVLYRQKNGSVLTSLPPL